MSDDATETDRWYARPVEDVERALDTDLTGLTEAEAARRREEHGPNRLPRAAAVPAWRILLRQFRDPLIYILLAAAVVSLAVGEATDAIFIGVVLLVNAAIGGVQEWQAERSSRALQELIETRATVLRDGDAREVDSEALVPGDVIRLESGGRVPADVRLTHTQDLAVDEAPLTGESAPVTKDYEWLETADVPLGDRRNVAYAGTTVTRGRATGIVVATGSNTAVGQLAEDVTAVEGGKPPLVVRMERFTRVVGIAVLLAAAITAAFGVVVLEYGALEMFLFSVALAVSAIPEGLPVGVTVALGNASRRMAAVGVIVRQLVAIEGLGSCTMIATDKTGTLTANEMTVSAVRLPDGRPFEVTGTGYEPAGRVLAEDGNAPNPTDRDALDRLARAVVSCNEGTLVQRDGEWTWRGDPTDIACLSLARKLGVTPDDVGERWDVVTTIPFESQRRYAASFVEGEDGVTVFVKGGPERVLGMCDRAAGDATLADAETAVDAMAAEGYRVLAVAAGRLDERPDPADPPEPAGLTCLGFLGQVDPIRPGVESAIEAARRAGITVTMVTGDHPETALSIARELGMASSREAVTTGADLAGASPERLRELVETTRVFARVSPSQKLDIVEAAKAAGHHVAVTGDGVNDAPALREANIGVAMGKSGTDVARDTADLVISDDNFATIVDGVRQGRIAYDNIRKIVYLLVSTGAAEVVLVFLSLLAGMPLPLTPVQILWLNLVTNGIQDVALAFEPEEGDALDRPPRPPTERIFDRLMVERVLVGALVMGPLAFGVFAWLVAGGLPAVEARNQILLLMVLFEIVNIGNARSETASMLTLSPLRSPVLLAGTITAFLVHVAALYVEPARAVLETAPVPVETWLVLAGVAMTIAVAIELHKLALRARRD